MRVKLRYEDDRGIFIAKLKNVEKFICANVIEVGF
jgi:hypothetical protein